VNTQVKFTSLKTNKFIQFIVYSNLWISIGSALLCWQVFYLNKLEFNLNYFLFVLFSTLVSYTFQRLFRLKSIAKFNNKAWVVLNKKTAIILTVIGVIGALCTLPQFLSFSILWWLIPSGIISLLYSSRRRVVLSYQTYGSSPTGICRSSKHHGYVTADSGLSRRYWR